VQTFFHNEKQRFFFSGVCIMTEPLFTAVTAARKIQEKSFSTFNVAGTEIVICRFRGEYFAIENRCSHALSTFDEGRMRGYRITCPLHGATFDIRDGSCTGLPAKHPIRSFPLRIVDGMIEVKLPG
jgi:3-phenylpropionate/trans-cinnamate dioxygenase ferredoxin subunit